MPRFLFNAQVGDGTYLKEIAEVAEHLHHPKHGNEDLGDQMQLRWSADPKHRAAVFMLHLHGILHVQGITCDDPDWLVKLGGDDWSGPLP